MLTLNIGGGKRDNSYKASKGEVLVNLDVSKFAKPTVWGRAESMPFKSNTFDRVWTHHVFEHLYTDQLIKTMEEIHRICKPDAEVHIHVPHVIHHSALVHVDHKRFYGTGTFDFLLAEHQKDASDQYTDKTFKKEKIVLYYQCPHQLHRPNIVKRFLIKTINLLSNKFPSSYERFWGYWVGGSEEIYYFLKVVK